MNRQDSHLLSGAYALHAVSTDEAAAVEAAMRGSEDLRGEIAELTDTAVALGLSLRPIDPPPALRSRLLAALDTTAQLPKDEPSEQQEVPEPFAAPTVSDARHVAPRRRPRLRRPALVLASALAAVLLFGGGVLVNNALQAPTGYQAIAIAPDLHQATSRIAGGGTASVMWSKSEGRTAVVLTDVTAPSGKVLQLWRVRGSSVTSAGVYEPKDGTHYVLLDGTPAAGEKLAVSVEPTGGSTHPTTVPIAQVALSA